MRGHPVRKCIRIPGFDYASPGAYFITVCTQGRVCRFGQLRDGITQLTSAGELAASAWSELPGHFAHVSTDAFVVMPNHVHGILILEEPVGAKHASPQHSSPLPPSPLPSSPPPSSPVSFGQGARGTSPGSLPAVVQAFKSAAARWINMDRCTPGAPVWQRGYFEHVVRGPRELGRLRRYIESNPLRWELDRENPTKA